MPESALITFIAAELKAGTPNHAIREKLMEGGWSAVDIDKALSDIGAVNTNRPPKPPKLGRRLPVEYRKKARHVLSKTLLLLVAGGLAYLGYYYFYLNSPARILERSLGALEGVQSVAYAADIRLELSPDLVLGLMFEKEDLQEEDSAAHFGGLLPARLAIGGDGAIDWRDPTNTVSRMSVSFRAVGPLEQSTVAIEYRAKDRQSYFRVTDRANLEDSPLAQLSGQWITYDFEAASQRFDGSWLVDIANRRDFPFVFSRLLKSLPASGAITELDRLVPTDIDGLDVWRLRPELNNQRFREQLKRAFGDSESEAGYLDTVTISNIELWVGKEDNLPYRLMFEMVGGEEGSQAAVQATLILKGFGQPVEVELPDSALPFQWALRLLEQDRT